MGTYGALVHREIFKFNYIHDYDIIGQVLAWHAIIADECLS